jgi:hypothetical protein
LSVVSVCEGAFRDHANEIEGAPGPMYIHTEKAKTKAKEAVERQRQRSGGTPEANRVGKRFLDGMDDPEGVVCTTHSGSMTQETFNHYVDHFIGALPENHGPTILLLDGHGSRWNVPALEKLMENEVYPFFIASHTSVWAQPNDCGVNKRFHWAVEEAVRRKRRMGQPTVQYFNEALTVAWKLFVNAERSELRNLGYNNTTNAYERTGIYPLNPFAIGWMEAIDSLGLQEKCDETKVRYEPIVKSDIAELSPEDRAVLREGFGGPVHSTLCDSEIALLRGEEILSKWRRKVEAGVSEGNEENDYARNLLPSSCAADELALEVATRLIEFEIVDVTRIELPEKKTKEEKTKEHTDHLVKNTAVLEPLQVSCLNTDSDSESVSGLAVKMESGKWQVMINGGLDKLEVDEGDLLDDTKYFVEHKFQNRSAAEVRRAAQKQKRKRRQEQEVLERILEEKAREKRKENDKREFETMMKEVAVGLLSKKPMSFDNFSAMVTRLRAPFEVEIDNHHVSVTESDAAIMMKKSAIQAITENVLVVKKRKADDDSDTTTNKRQRGRATVNTAYGANGQSAMNDSNSRNERDNKKQKKKDKSQLTQELHNIKEAIAALKRRKDKCAARTTAAVAAAKRRFEKSEENENCDSTSTEAYGNGTQGEGSGFRSGVTPSEQRYFSDESYWEIGDSSDQSDLVLFLRLFRPDCKKLSKPKEAQWAFLQSNILPVSKARVDSREEEYRERIPVINALYAEINDVTEDA